jgi:hypothetical protein
MAKTRPTHHDRERVVLSDLQSSFPNLAGFSGAWDPVPNRNDPPDFISRDAGAVFGLELVEWLDGDQMGQTQSRESQQEQLQRVLAHEWESQYKPTRIRSVFVSPTQGTKIKRKDEARLRSEFYACVSDVDAKWLELSNHRNGSFHQTDFQGHLLLQKYLNSINYVGGGPLGICWIHPNRDGGAFDPKVVIETLKATLNSKLSDYSSLEKQQHLRMQGLTRLDLLVHGGFNIYAYNKPRGHISLEEIASRGADYYALHPQRLVFDRVYFFHSLNSADELNAFLGFAPGAGRVRWLAQLWPQFEVFSVGGFR